MAGVGTGLFVWCLFSYCVILDVSGIMIDTGRFIGGALRKLYVNFRVCWMWALTRSGCNVPKVCKDCKRVSPSATLSWSNGSVFLDPAEMHRMIQCLPATMVAEEIRDTTIQMEDGESAVLLVISCIHGEKAIRVLKILVGPTKCQVLHIAFCEHQQWVFERRDGGPLSRMSVWRWVLDEAADRNKAIEKTLKKWCEGQFKRSLKNGSEPEPMVKEFVGSLQTLVETRAEDSCRTTRELVRRIPGVFYFVVGENSGCGKRLVLPHEERLVEVRMMTWVPLNIDEILQVIEYNECDATFKSCRPYVAIVIQGVVRNVGLPLCLTLVPGERHVSYQFAYQCIADTLRRKGREDLARKLFSIPVLSDMGSALGTFVEDYNLVQYWCHRHLIERFGASDLLSDVYRTVLSSTNWSQANDIVEEFISKSQDVLEHCSRKAAKPLKLAIDKMGKAMQTYEKWSQEVKLSRGHGFVATTTNHAESFHRHMNTVTATRRHPLTRAMKVLKLIMKKYTNFEHSAALNAKRKFDKLRKEAMAQVEKGVSKSLFERDACTCGRRSINAYVYGTEFPCLCNILSWKECPVPEVQLNLTRYMCPGEAVTMTPETVYEIFHIEVPKQWTFQSSKENSGPVVRCQELDEFALDLKARPWFTSLRNEIARKSAVTQDEATWKLVKYFYKLKANLEQLTAVDMALHEFQLLKPDDAA